MSLVCTRISSPVGDLQLVASDEALCSLCFVEQRGARPAPARAVESHPILDVAARQLGEYFRGERVAFTVPLAPAGTTFERAVYRALGTIAFGERRSYGAIARAIGRPGAARAVGAANAKNPLSIVVPCHRVVGSGGALTGYAGGVDRKRWLLEHEARVRDGA